jgi:hypothetical protein
VRLQCHDACTFARIALMLYISHRHDGPHTGENPLQDMPHDPAYVVAAQLCPLKVSAPVAPPVPLLCCKGTGMSCLCLCPPGVVGPGVCACKAPAQYRTGVARARVISRLPVVRFCDQQPCGHVFLVVVYHRSLFNKLGWLWGCSLLGCGAACVKQGKVPLHHPAAQLFFPCQFSCSVEQQCWVDSLKPQTYAVLCVQKVCYCTAAAVDVCTAAGRVFLTVAAV